MCLKWIYVTVIYPAWYKFASNTIMKVFNVHLETFKMTWVLQSAIKTASNDMGRESFSHLFKNTPETYLTRKKRSDIKVQFYQDWKHYRNISTCRKNLKKWTTYTCFAHIQTEKRSKQVLYHIEFANNEKRIFFIALNHLSTASLISNCANVKISMKHDMIHAEQSI